MRSGKRAFVRDDVLSIRMPSETKRRLVMLAGKMARDTSNLALEYIRDRIAREERQIDKKEDASGL